MTAKITNLDTCLAVTVYCPVCGKMAESCDPEKSEKIVPCEHLLFTYYTGEIRFNHVSPSCKQITDRAVKAAEEYDIDAFSYAIEQLHSRSVLCFSTNFVSGIRYYFAFTFGPVACDEE
jgi:hypothetical protein